MKTKYSIKLPILYLALFSALFSCDSFVEVELPKSQLTAVTVFEDYSTAEAALSNIFASIRDSGMLTGTGTGISNQLGHYADELISTQTASNPNLPFYNNSLLPANTTVASYWNYSYYQIYSANSLIEGVQQSTILTTDQKRLLVGEALFIRALMHFYLVNLFGDVPYVTQTDLKTNSKISRTSIALVYEKVIADLQNSIKNLPNTYIDTQRTLPNIFTAKALLARVFLYSGAFSAASEQATAILNQQEFYSMTSINSAFLIDSKETIWQLHSGAAGNNAAQGSYFILLSAPPRLASLSNQLVNSFESNDLRKANWIKSVSNVSSTWYFPFKYKENIPTSNSKEYSVIFRLAEQYLIRAEARVKQGDLIGAKEDLNKIRLRAGLDETMASSQSEIISAIQIERKHELFTEFGHRFFDLKRTGNLDTTLQGIKPGWNPTDSLFPIPQNELSANPNLGSQNPGY